VIAATKQARSLVAQHDAWLFQATFPKSSDELQAARDGLAALAARVAALPAASPLAEALANSGIAGSEMASTYSLAATQWLVQRFGHAVQLAYLEADPQDAMALLDDALDPVERQALVDEPLRWPAWQRRHLGDAKRERLKRLVALVQRLPGDSRSREAAWARLQVFIRWRMAAHAPTLTAGRFGRNHPHTHESGYLRAYGPEQAFAQPAPRAVPLAAHDREHLVDLGRGVMISLLRETDFFTHADAAQMECWDMGRGIQIALYSMQPERQHVLESYIGYLLLKNHVPVAYGGSWILGPQAAFGVNVLPPYRGGESALVVCQLLRLYAWRFKLRTLRVEASQIGRDNKDGIASGSFWFYWRLGFRPEQAALTALAEREWARILQESGGRPAARFYRPEVLKTLADAVLVWQPPGSGAPWCYVEGTRIAERVSAHVLQHFDGDRDAATRAALRQLGGGASPALKRMALALAALAPQRGWSAAEAARWHALARVKSTHEPDHARAMATHAPLLKALAALGRQAAPA
jgi:hypothetical protein